MVSPEYVPGRIAYAKWMKRQSDKFIERIACVDGTSYFLDKETPELGQTQRRALGCRVWMEADRSESLHEDCTSASPYNKGQGERVTIWGLLANGLLKVWILEKNEHMTTELYCQIVEDGFEDWLGECNRVICDYEGCLRSNDARDSLKSVGLQILEQHPKQAQDLNPIENIWNLLKARLHETMPTHLESREAFIKRVHEAVRFLNWKKQDEMSYLSTNLKERAADVLQLKGARTGWQALGPLLDKPLLRQLKN